MSNSYIVTYTGKPFDLLEPTPDMIDKMDIAHALSNLCRYAGHSKIFYSVGQHSLLVEREMEKRGESTLIRLYGLLHDASEAYLCDIPRPLKPCLTNYQQLEDNVMNCVFQYFGLPIPTDEEWTLVKYYDDYILANEIGQVAPDSSMYDIRPEYDVVITEMPNRLVKEEFLYRLDMLLDKYREERMTNGS